MNPTKSEKRYWDRLVNIIGCVACRINGIFNNYAVPHHIDGRTKKGAHSRVIPLCFWHHQGGSKDDPSVHPWKSRFEEKYGKQLELKKMCDEILNNEMIK